MRWSCGAALLLVFILFISIFLASLTNLISVETRATRTFKEKIIDSSDKHRANSGPDSVIKINNRLNETPNQLMWFIQISDIHISIFNDADRIVQLKEFLTETVDAIKPSVILASGDLTDARDPDILGSSQHEREWEIYKESIQSSGVLNKTKWLDIRGNHDNFNVPSVDSEKNYFIKYSVQGKEHKHSYKTEVIKDSIKYTFLAVDACLNQGPKRPFNFIGYMTENELSNVIDLANNATAEGSDYLIWYGHYPTSCIITEHTGSWGFRNVIGKYNNSMVYLCGHLHNFGGLVPRMYTLQKDGFLELELGDWKKTRMFRVAAVDHGLFSFVDILHNTWPIILVTNPKHAMFHIPGKEDEDIQLTSTHIRFLIFSKDPVKSCRLKIDDGNWMPCNQSAENFYAVKWNPSLFENGLHHIHIHAIDAQGRENYINHPFEFNGNTVGFDFLGRLALMSDFSAIFRGFFILALTICAAPIILFRLLYELTKRKVIAPPQIKCRCFRDFVLQFTVLAAINRLSIPILLYLLYVAVGPWMIGEVIDGHMGYVFSWGIFVNGGYVPVYLTYLYGFFQLMLSQFPLTIIFANIVYRKYRSYAGHTSKPKNNIVKKIIHAPYILIIGVELILAILFWRGYGALAFLLAPFRTWVVIMNLLLWRMARRVPADILIPIVQVLHNNSPRKVTDGDEQSDVRENSYKSRYD